MTTLLVLCAGATLTLGSSAASSIPAFRARVARPAAAPSPPFSFPGATLDLLVDAPVQIDGARTTGRLGDVGSIASGDVNGDGRADLVGGTTFGAAFVAFGPFPALLDLRTIRAGGGPGFRIVGRGLSQRVSVAGDVNGDGLDDILLLSDDAATAYVVFGRTETSNVDLAGLASSGGYEIVLGGADELAYGATVAGAGDVNGDGHADLLVALPAAEVVYVVFGKATTSAQDVAHLGSGGYPVDLPSGRVPGALAAAGDVDRDGLDDILIGAAGSPTGTVWVVFGKANTSREFVDALGTTAGYAIAGATPTVGEDGTAVNAGDVNGDGRPDQLVVDTYLGATPAIVFGKGSPTTAVDTAALRSRGYLIQHEDPSWLPGTFVSAIAGGVDLNGDGRADQVFGYDLDQFSERFGAGAAYVVYGKATTASIVMGDGGTGYRLDGPPASYLGGSVALAPAGADPAQVFVGAPHNYANGRLDAGSVYVVSSSATPKAHPPASGVRLTVEPPRGARTGTRRTLRFTVRHSLRLEARLEQVIAGRIRGGSRPTCRAGAGAPPAERCTVVRDVATWRAVHRHTGRATLTLARALAPGRYRLLVVVTDASGRRFSPYRLRFNVR
jgi:hypothetical protein